MQLIQAARNAFGLPDLRRKILYTFLILAIYRLAAHVPVPGVNQEALRSLFGGGTPLSGFAGILDLLSGGAISNFSVLAMGVYPYITAQIIVQLLVPIIPYLEKLSKEKDGRDKINQYVVYATIPLAALNAIGNIRLLTAGAGQQVLPNFGFTGEQLLPSLSIIATMTAGTMFAMWLGQLIDEQGIGNGISLIIFGGIVARLPQNIGQILADPTTAVQQLIAFTLITVATIVVIVYMQEGQRNILVQYPKRVVGTKMMGGGSTHIPLRINTAGMIPLIFAQSILTFPAIIVSLFPSSFQTGSLAYIIRSMFGGGRTTHASWADWTAWFYWIVYFLFVVGFTFFYTDVMMQQQKIGEMLTKQGAMIPGRRPGKDGKLYEEYINGIMRRITLVGALALGLVAILPFLVTPVLPTATSFSFMSTGLLIVVGVVLDTMRQLDAQLSMRHYAGFLKRMG